MTSLVFYIVVGSSIWVGIDASRLGAKRGTLDGGFFDMGPLGWFFGVLLFWIVGFPAYIAKRPKYVARSRSQPTTAESLRRAGEVDIENLQVPGWYPDPRNPELQRYFDGTNWTNLPPPPPID